jgi:hypothetical protein
MTVFSSRAAAIPASLLFPAVPLLFLLLIAADPLLFRCC